MVRSCICGCFVLVWSTSVHWLRTAKSGRDVERESLIEIASVKLKTLGRFVSYTLIISGCKFCFPAIMLNVKVRSQ
jgi:hypothetical protein